MRTAIRPSRSPRSRRAAMKPVLLALLLCATCALSAVAAPRPAQRLQPHDHHVSFVDHFVSGQDGESPAPGGDASYILTWGADGVPQTQTLTVTSVLQVESADFQPTVASTKVSGDTVTVTFVPNDTGSGSSGGGGGVRYAVPKG